MKKNTVVKMVAEVYLIPICVLYLLYMLLNGHNKASFIVCLIISFFTALEFMIKYLKEVYVYKNKYNFLKLSFGIFNILFVIILGLNIFYKIYIIKLLFIIGIIVLLLFLISFSIFNIRKFIKDSKKTMFVVKSFLSFLSFCMILITFLIYVL